MAEKKDGFGVGGDGGNELKLTLSKRMQSQIPRVILEDSARLAPKAPEFPAQQRTSAGLSKKVWCGNLSY
jgi:hypothetical protein